MGAAGAVHVETDVVLEPNRGQLLKPWLKKSSRNCCCWANRH